MLITPDAEIRLTHRAYHVATTPAGHIAAVARHGHGSFFTPDTTEAVSFIVGADSKCITIAPDGRSIAIVTNRQLRILSTNDFQLHHRLFGDFESAHFGSDGILWTSTFSDTESVTVERWAPATWERLARAQVSDPFGGSVCFLVPHPDPDSVVAWAAAGQDGQSLFWLRHQGSVITSRLFPELTDTSWPSFSPDRQHFLVITGNNIECYRYPDGPRTGRIPWTSEEDDQPGDFIWYAGPNHAIVQSNQQRLYWVDLDSLTIEEELIVEGHEPTLIYGRMCSDVAGLLPYRETQYLSVHTGLPAGDQEAPDHLLLWGLPESKV